MKGNQLSLASVPGKLSRAEMKQVMGGAMACANCPLPNQTVCVWYNANEKRCTDSGYGSVWCINTNTGEQSFHDCEMPE
jgi:hypothetical protein